VSRCQGVKLILVAALLAPPRAAAPRVAFVRRKDPRDVNDRQAVRVEPCAQEVSPNHVSGCRQSAKDVSTASERPLSAVDRKLYVRCEFSHVRQSITRSPRQLDIIVKHHLLEIADEDFDA
jgi:hypothetical protein